MDNKNAYVRYTVQDRIGTIEFFTAQQNALPANILKELALVIESAGKDPDSKVLILRSGPSRTFCAGASFEELLHIKTAEEGKQFFSGFARVINHMRKCPKFILGRIQGKAIGGGVGLAASCDYTFATHEASVKLSELTIGIGPFVIGPAIERKIGIGATGELTIDAGNFRTAEWAKQKGLYADLFNNEACMDDAIHQMATQLAASSSEAMSKIKKSFWMGTENWDELLYERAAISGSLVISEETKAFLAAFKKWG